MPPGKWFGAPDQHVRKKPARWRVQAAVDKVLAGEFVSQADAARWAGVNQQNLNVRVRAARKGLAVQRAETEMKSVSSVLERMSPARRAEIEARRERDKLEVGRASAIEVSGRPLDDQAKRVPRDVVEFYDRYFGGIVCRQHLVHHDLPEFHKEIMRAIVDPAEKRTMVNVPYGHSKSTCGTLITSLFDIAHNPNFQLGVVSATSRLAERFVFQIRQFLTDSNMYKGSANLIEEAGPFVNDEGRLGNNQEFRVHARESIDKDPTVAAYGYGQEIQSTRLDRIVGDDFATRRNHRNPDRIVQMFEDITQDWLSRLDEAGQLVLIGTRVGPGDVWSMLDELPSFKRIRFPWVLDYDEGLVLWPEHMDFDSAMLRKGSVTPQTWEYAYQNSSYVSDESGVTKEQLDRCHSPRVLGQLPDEPILLFVGIDPAGSGKQAGYTAGVLLGVNPQSGKRFLIDVFNVKSMRGTQLEAQLFDWMARYQGRGRAVRVESVGTQSQIFDNIAYRQHAVKTSWRIEEHKTSGQGGIAGKWDPYWGVEAMANVVHSTMVDIPWGDDDTRRRVGELEHQWMTFPADGAPTDLLMAFWFAETGCRRLVDKGRRNLYQSYGHQHRHMPAEFAARRRVHRSGQQRAARAKDFLVEGTARGSRRRYVNIEGFVDDDV